jgi:hypothetical protein
MLSNLRYCTEFPGILRKTKINVKQCFWTEPEIFWIRITYAIHATTTFMRVKEADEN